MDSTLSALVTLGVVIGLTIVAIRFSLHLFLQDGGRFRHFSRPVPLANKPLPAHETYVVRRPKHDRVDNKAYSSARYAWHSMRVIALLLLLAVVAIISVLSGIMH